MFIVYIKRRMNPHFGFNYRKPFSKISRILTSARTPSEVIFSRMMLALQVVSCSEFPTISQKVCICLVLAILITVSRCWNAKPINFLWIFSQNNLSLTVLFSEEVDFQPKAQWELLPVCYLKPMLGLEYQFIAKNPGKSGCSV